MKAIIGIRTRGGVVTAEAVRRRYGLDAHELEDDGFVPDPDNDRAYTILVDEESAGKLQSTPEWELTRYSNPRIEPTSR